MMASAPPARACVTSPAPPGGQAQSPISNAFVTFVTAKQMKDFVLPLCISDKLSDPEVKGKARLMLERQAGAASHSPISTILRELSAQAEAAEIKCRKEIGMPYKEGE